MILVILVKILPGKNPGIDPNILTDDIFTSLNLEDYISNPDKYNKIYLVDLRWLTYKEENEKPIFYFTFHDNHIDSKKFINAIIFNVVKISDFVFSSNYKLETIEQHSKFMFNNKHLPSLCSQKNYENFINFNSEHQRTENILEELEKAHIYIDQLNNNLKSQEKKNK